MTQSISNKMRNKTRMFTFSTRIQYSAGIPSQSNKRSKYKIYKWEGQNQSIHISTYDSIHKRPQGLNKKTQFSKLSRYKVTIQKSFHQLRANKCTEKETGQTIPVHNSQTTTEITHSFEYSLGYSLLVMVFGYRKSKQDNLFIISLARCRVMENSFFKPLLLT